MTRAPEDGHQEVLMCVQEGPYYLVKFKDEVIGIFWFGVNYCYCGHCIVCEKGNMSDIRVGFYDLICFGCPNV